MSCRVPARSHPSSKDEAPDRRCVARSAAESPATEPASSPSQRRSYCDLPGFLPGWTKIGFLFLFNHAAVALEIAAGHDICRKILLYPLANQSRVELRPLHTQNHILDGCANTAGHTLTNNFGYSPTPKREYRSSASHRFDHDQPKWLLPLDWEQHSHRAAKQFIFYCEVSLAHIFNEPPIDMRLNFGFKIVSENGLNLSGNLQWNAGALRDFDRGMHPLQRCDSAKKAQIPALLLLIPVLAQIDAVVNRRQVQIRIE